MGMFKALEISGSGLSAQRQKMNAISSNIANAETTKTPEGGPYKRKKVALSENQSKAKFVEILEKNLELKTTHPAHLSAKIREGFQDKVVSEVSSKEVVDENQPTRLVYDPSHPDADENGYVAYPDINIINEMVDMMSSSRAYEANVTAVNATKNMVNKALEI